MAISDLRETQEDILYFVAFSQRLLNSNSRVVDGDGKGGALTVAASCLVLSPTSDRFDVC